MLPLLHNSLPVRPSSAYSTACADFDTVVFTSLDRNSPLDTANTTPLTTIGGKSETRSRDDQPCSIAGTPFWSTTFNAAMWFPEGASTQRVPSASCQVANAPAG